MGKDLTTMIEEINDASSTLNRTGKADDPVSLFPGFIFQMTMADSASSRSSPKWFECLTVTLPNYSRLTKVPLLFS